MTGVPTVFSARCPRARRAALAAICITTAAVMGFLGCARGIDRPDTSLPRTAGDDLERTDDPGTDQRTIERTGDRPDGPITPGGSEIDPNASPGGGSVRVDETGETDPRVLASAAPAGAVDGTARPEGASGYFTVGGVLAEVNGRAIYTDELIAALRNQLRGMAAQADSREAFVEQARALLSQELTGRIRDEMLRLVAVRNLTNADRQRALFAATNWRVTQITAAGGSEARARYLAAESGFTLEELVADKEREFLLALFVQAVVLPRATPSADEVREYYRRHPQEFGPEGRGEIEFLLIELSADIGASQGITREQALQRAEHVRQLAAGGADFAALASEYNDNADYRARAGKVPGTPLGRGDFRWPAVDAAAWATPVGGVTPVVADDEGRRLFVAKVIRKDEPRAVDFGEAQRVISEMITNRRRLELIEQYIEEAREYAAITPDAQIAQNLQTALEVVAQHYEAWRQE